MARSEGDPLRVSPTKIAPESHFPPQGGGGGRAEAHATEADSNELKAPKANGFAKGEATALQAFTVCVDDEN
jgi:hypothetical protein